MPFVGPEQSNKMNKEDAMDRSMSATLAGVAGAVAMMGFSLLSRKLGFSHGDTLHEQTAEAALQTAGKAGAVSENQEEALGIGMQLGFSMSSAMTYSKVRKYLSVPGPLAGALFGVALWGVRLVGLAPMLGIRSAPWKQDEGKAITTFLSHVVFGVVMGVLFDQLSPEEDA